MKQFVCLIILCGWYVCGFSQLSAGITTGKTSCFIFPSEIVHVDRGSNFVLVQPVNDAGHVLLVKAASVNFDETNISVITVDGKVYSIMLHYDSLPASFMHMIGTPDVQVIQEDASRLLDVPRRAHGMKDKSLDIRVAVTGMYVRNTTLYLQLQLSNEGPIDYIAEQLQVSLRDKGTTKRTAMQELALTPLYIAGNTKIIKRFSVTRAVIALEQFTIPDAKVFTIRIFEKNGGRHLQVTIHNKDIIKAVAFTDYHE